MNKINKYIKTINILIILILLSGCNGEFNSIRKENKNDQLINSQKRNSKDKLEIKITCDEEGISKYLKDGWMIKDKKSRDKVCSWKSIPANNTCDIQKEYMSAFQEVVNLFDSLNIDYDELGFNENSELLNKKFQDGIAKFESEYEI